MIKEKGSSLFQSISLFGTTPHTRCAPSQCATVTLNKTLQRVAPSAIPEGPKGKPAANRDFIEGVVGYPRGFEDSLAMAQKPTAALRLAKSSRSLVKK